MDPLLALGIVFISTFFLGQLLEMARIPWIFASLLVGIAFRYFSIHVEGAVYNTMSGLGLYFMLFMIGMELDLRKLSEGSGLIAKSAAAIILGEALIMGILIRTIFGTTWPVSFLVSLSFATVGEVMILPILDELNLLKKRLGQLILGIATVDDVFELISFIMLTFIVSGRMETNSILVFLSLLAFTIISLKYHVSRKLFSMPIESLFLLVISIIFLFIGVGAASHEPEIASIFAGIVASHSMPRKKFGIIEKEMKSMIYGLFGPVFFFSVGMETDVGTLMSNPLTILIIVFASNASKIIGAVVSLSGKLGLKKSIFAGMALSVRFSTSLVIAKILYNYSIISSELFTIIIGSSIIFTFAIPPIISWIGRRL